MVFFTEVQARTSSGIVEALEASLTRSPLGTTLATDDLRMGDGTAQKQLARLYIVSLLCSAVLRSYVEVAQPPLQR